MANKSYFDAFGAIIAAGEVASKAGLSYIAAATAMRLAGRPEATFVDFGGKPYLEMLGGAVVAVDLKIPDTDSVQRMYLPVMDRDNMPLNLAKTSLTDINNNRQRCLVKAIAAVYGDGMSLYMGCDGDGAKAVKLLGVNPESDLETVTPVIATLKEGGAPYIEWNVGLAACRITDPTFRWEVVMWDGLPYREVLGGLMVDVDTVYEGLRQRISLPIMDGAFEPVPVAKATVSDWNKTVMRALTKCIAFNTGYGLGVYADEFGKDDDASKAGRKASTTKADAKADTKAKADAKTEVKAPAKTEVKAEAKADAADAKTDAVAEAKAEAAAPANVEAQASAEPTVTDAVAKTEVSTPAATTAEAKVEAAAPAAEATEAQAPATETAAAPAAEPASASAPAAAAPAADTEAVTRFRGVLQKRRETGGTAGVLSLFDALKTSTKFEDADKPACFSVLITAAASIVDGDHITELLGNLLVYKASQHIAADSRDVVGAKLTSVALNTALPQGDEAIVNVTQDLINSGVAKDFDEVLRFAALGNVQQETIELVRDAVELAAA